METFDIPMNCSGPVVKVLPDQSGDSPAMPGDLLQVALWSACGWKLSEFWSLRDPSGTG